MNWKKPLYRASALDYNLVQKLFRWPVLLGIPFEVVFQVLEDHDGFFTPWSLRVAAIINLMVLATFPNIFKKAHKLFFELSLLYLLGFHVCFMFIMNPDNYYAMISWNVVGFFLGFMTQPILVLPHWVASITISHIIGIWFFPDVPIHSFGFSLKFHIATLWTMGTGCMIRLMLQKHFRIQKELEFTKHTNTILKWRNDTISIFIRPSILKEIESGFNPLEFKPQLREKTIMVCDLRNFSGISNTISGEKMHALMNQYFDTVLDPIYEEHGEVDKLSGDGIIAIFKNSLNAVNAAVNMRRHLQDLNKIRLANGERKLRNVITLASGQATEANYGKLNRKLDRTVIGIPINVASRMESVAKAFDVEILISESVIKNIPDYQHARIVDRIRVKGLQNHFYVYEVFEHQAPNVIDYKMSTRVLLEKGLKIYFENKGIKDAYRIFRALEEKMPRHNYSTNVKMDPIIGFHLYRLEQWIKDPGRWNQLLEDWIACDDFEFDAPPADWMVIPRS